MKAFDRRLFLLAAAGVATVASAQVAVPADPKMREIAREPISYAVVTPGMSLRDAKWIPYKKTQSETGREAESWQTAFDTLNWDLVADAHNTAVYGVTPPGTLNWTTGGTPNKWWNIPYVVDDMKLWPGTDQGFAQRMRVRWMWNPDNADYPNTTGTANCYMLIATGTTANTGDLSGNPLHYGPAYSGWLYGYVFNFGSLAGGAYLATLTNFSLPLPNTTTQRGAVIMQVGTNDTGGNLVPLPNGAAQWRYTVNCSPTSPNYAGTNQSDSDKYAWQDTSHPNPVGGGATAGPDFILQNWTVAGFSELYNNEITISSQLRRYHPGIGMAIDLNAVLMNGTIDFGPTPPQSIMRFDLVGVDANGTPLRDMQNAVIYDTQYVAVGPTGLVKLIDPKLTDADSNPVTRYIVSNDLGAPYVRRNSAILDISGGSTTFSLRMRSGDIDNDDSVTVYDYNVMSDYFDKTSDDSDWSTVGGNGSAPKDADLDSDGSITVYDYNILSDGFDASDDTDLLS